MMNLVPFRTMNRTLEVVRGHLVSGLGLGRGLIVTPTPRTRSAPKEPLILFEFESCPFCRRVREVLSSLDLDAEIRPCPPGGERYRKEAEKLGGKRQFPLLVDRNRDVTMYESQAIIVYLAETYAHGTIPVSQRFVPLALASSVAMSGLEGRLRARPSRAAELPLELWSFEASPYCRMVRQRLCELELPYMCHNLAKGSPRRPEFVSRFGKMQVPFLRDPNTQEEMFESADIIAYLDRAYAL